MEGGRVKREGEEEQQSKIVGNCLVGGKNRTNTDHVCCVLLNLLQRSRLCLTFTFQLYFFVLFVIIFEEEIPFQRQILLMLMCVGSCYSIK